MPWRRAFLTIRFRLPPCALLTYQIHIPSPARGLSGGSGVCALARSAEPATAAQARRRAAAPSRTRMALVGRTKAIIVSVRSSQQPNAVKGAHRGRPRSLPGLASPLGSLLDRTQDAVHREHVAAGADHQRAVDAAPEAGELRPGLRAQQGVVVLRL